MERSIYLDLDAVEDNTEQDPGDIDHEPSLPHEAQSEEDASPSSGSEDEDDKLEDPTPPTQSTQAENVTPNADEGEHEEIVIRGKKRSAAILDDSNDDEKETASEEPPAKRLALESAVSIDELNEKLSCSQRDAEGQATQNPPPDTIPTGVDEDVITNRLNADPLLAAGLELLQDLDLAVLDAPENASSSDIKGGDKAQGVVVFPSRPFPPGEIKESTPCLSAAATMVEQGQAHCQPEQEPCVVQEIIGAVKRCAKIWKEDLELLDPGEISRLTKAASDARDLVLSRFDAALRVAPGALEVAKERVEVARRSEALKQKEAKLLKDKEAARNDQLTPRRAPFVQRQSRGRLRY